MTSHVVISLLVVHVLAFAEPVRVSLIDNRQGNASFEEGSGNISIAGWLTGFGGETQRKQDNAFVGEWSLVIGQSSGQPNLAASVMTSHTVLPGDQFDLSFKWLPKSGWDAGDQVKWRLFTSSDDTVSGTLNQIASGTVSGFANGAGYQSAAISDIEGGDAVHEGKKVWLQFLRGASSMGEFARVDEVELTVTTDDAPEYISLLADDLVAYYPMEGDVLDYSLLAPVHDGLWQNAETYLDGGIDEKCAFFNGIDASVSIPNIFQKDFTLSFWMLTTGTASSGSQWGQGVGLVDASEDGAGASGWGVVQLGHRVAFGVADTTLQSQSVVNDGRWHQVCVQRHSISGVIRLFVDGVLESETQAESGPRSSGIDVCLGALRAGGGFFNGHLDDVRVFSSLLDEAGVAAIYQSRGDYDGDGSTDFEEHVAASPWTNAQRGIAPVAYRYDDANNTFILTVDAMAGRRYQLQRSSSLDPGSWQAVGEPVTPKYHGLLDLIDADSNGIRYFYRTVILGRGPAREKQPNVVFIYGDDVGYGDVKAYNPDSKIETPHIDTLASQGIRFTDGHCSASTCSPSRFSMLTGVFAFRYGVGIIKPTGKLSIPQDMYTLPDMFKDAGYRTAVVGKWHLGMGEGGDEIQWNGDISPSPLDIGFDYSFILPTTNDRVPCIYMEGRNLVNADYMEAVDEVANPGTGILTVAPLSRDGDGKVLDPVYVHNSSYAAVNVAGSTSYPQYSETDAADRLYNSNSGHNHSFINGMGRIGYMSGGAEALWEDQTQAFVFLEKAKQYIAAQDEQTPFFLYFASQDIHVPRAPHEAFQGSSSLGWRGDAMVQFDWTVGQIIQALEEAGLSEDTIVILSSDNGPVYGDGYADGSGDDATQGHDSSGPWRGGKYSILEGGTRVPFIVKWPAKIEPGVSPALMNQVDFMASFAELLGMDLPSGSAVDSQSALPALLGHDQVGVGFTVEQNNTGSSKALRVGDMKYVSGGKLYDLSTDPTENNDRSGDPDYAKILNDMSAQLQSIVNGSGVRQQ
ncbi:sulfatase-like hydrolase/transferase [Verrucomicrobiaceae bacterium N1E253]|uniref:Sulfatase-like hydrolase/transferase n=1 Tax=Oceaniferula marina TaxID=2748318 RepID=A0A851GQ25_9BACT|nr:sulfatase-like hydrolase/transferase [Oceaniferula marina]NWK56254.1 sulfatase-like hydrolase/transferase [Oceaniferula marina]